LTIADVVRERGPLTVAAFMDLALYDSELGYYARAAQRSGRAGDFFTSVDVGPLFGELLAAQIAEMAGLLADGAAPASPPRFDLVEAGAGNGRLAADILRALHTHHPDVYAQTSLHLVEQSAPAREAQRDTLDALANRLASSTSDLPATYAGVLFANELLDAMPVHQVIMREDGLKEVYVAATGEPPVLVTLEGPPSTPELATYLASAGVTLEPGWRVEIGLAAAAWVRDAARRLRRGFIVLVDYGHDARELYSVTHSSGTLTTFSRHTAAGAESRPGTPPWIERPGEQDITAHVDFSTVQRVAEEEGATTIAFLDQTYFVMGIIGSQGAHGSRGAQGSWGSQGSRGAQGSRGSGALKTLMMPGGLGSTMKVLILGKGVGRPPLIGCSFRVRVT
jgi:SAM-dependent MidA family methyltransferase